MCYHWACMDYMKLREEPLKSAVREDFFAKYKYTQLGNIDFVIAKHNTEKGQRSLFEDEGLDGDLKSLLWAEAKQGTGHDIYESFVQLILTIGKERTFEKNLPPKYVGAFDAEKIAFIEYHRVQHIFYQNDFNWNVTPSNHDTKEFKQLHALCESILQESSILFKYETQAAELKEFIRLNFKADKDVSEKISVTKNNFTFVFQRWSQSVKPTISVDWEKAKKAGIISADFFLADLLSSENESLKDSLYVVLKKTKYELAKKIDELGFESVSTVGFNDIRERKGSFFTPQIWVEKSQQYIAAVLGEGWQDEYYVWDCAAGTGNLLNGLANYRNVFASTLDKQDVDVMKDRIANGWNMFRNHVFQFDFLNDDFTAESKGGKVPDDLAEILADEKKRRRLVIYINPPYAEAASTRTIAGTGENKTNVAVATKTYEKYLPKIGIAGRELFAQFFIRAYCEIGGCILAEFSKLKMIQAPNFNEFRQVFRAKLEKLFVVPARTFDNVKGNFPIGFFVWNTNECHTDSILLTQNQGNGHSEEKTVLAVSTPCDFSVDADAYDENGDFLQKRTFSTVSDFRSINDWIIQTRNRAGEKPIGYMYANGADFQHNSFNYIVNDKSQLPHPRGTVVTTKNVLEICVYLAVRQCIPQSWLNDRDQFLYPKDGWQDDREFQADCLVYTLFHGQNRISAETPKQVRGDGAGRRGDGTGERGDGGHAELVSASLNHWIPFTERQVGCKSAFKSTFMSDFLRDFLAGKVGIRNEEIGNSDGFFSESSDLIPDSSILSPHSLSSEAQTVYDAGLSLWKYYHAQPHTNPDASFYDIRRHFQGTDEKGRMNNESKDARYTELISDLRERQGRLAKKIEECVYKYGFLK